MTGRATTGVFEIETEDTSGKRYTQPQSFRDWGMHALCLAAPTSRCLAIHRKDERVCFQAGWFFGVCAVAAGLLGGVLLQLRARRAESLLRKRAEARLAERERLARDVHDTLLQGIQGLILRFQAVSERIPPAEPARGMMESALERADEVLLESRDRVNLVRESTSKRVP